MFKFGKCPQIPQGFAPLAKICNVCLWQTMILFCRIVTITIYDRVSKLITSPHNEALTNNCCLPWTCLQYCHGNCRCNCGRQTLLNLINLLSREGLGK